MFYFNTNFLLITKLYKFHNTVMKANKGSVIKKSIYNIFFNLLSFNFVVKVLIE